MQRLFLLGPIFLILAGCPKPLYVEVFNNTAGEIWIVIPNAKSTFLKSGEKKKLPQNRVLHHSTENRQRFPAVGIRPDPGTARESLADAGRDDADPDPEWRGDRGPRSRQPVFLLPGTCGAEAARAARIEMKIFLWISLAPLLGKGVDPPSCGDLTQPRGYPFYGQLMQLLKSPP